MDHGMLRRLSAVFLLSLGVATAGHAAMKVRQPTDSAPAGVAPAEAAVVSEGKEPQPQGSYFVGRVIFARGNQMVAEILGGAKERERFVIYDPSLRRRGQAVVTKALDKDVYLLLPAGKVQAGAGDHLARESETEAAARVLRENRMEFYREFLRVFPESSYRARIGREMFRLAVRSSYPIFPGSVVSGKVRLAESVGREVSLGQAEIVLDRFVIARTDEKGAFRIEGLPKLETPVTLKIRVKDPRFKMGGDVSLDLPAGQLAEVGSELSVKLTPTVLAGRVVDDKGSPLAGVEVWTDPYSMETLTDETGSFRILRKKTGSGGGSSERDEPLFGGEYMVYAHRKGYSVDRSAVSAESYRENPVRPIRLARQDSRGEDIPALGIDLKTSLEWGSTEVAAPQGGGPKLNP